MEENSWLVCEMFRGAHTLTRTTIAATTKSVFNELWQPSDPPQKRSKFQWSFKAFCQKKKERKRKEFQPSPKSSSRPLTRHEVAWLVVSVRYGSAAPPPSGSHWQLGRKKPDHSDDRREAVDPRARGPWRPVKCPGPVLLSGPSTRRPSTLTRPSSSSPSAGNHFWAVEF